MQPDIQHITVVISPLRSLMIDQVARCNSQGVNSAAIMRSDEMNDYTKEGTLIYYNNCTHVI